MQEERENIRRKNGMVGKTQHITLHQSQATPSSPHPSHLTTTNHTPSSLSIIKLPLVDVQEGLLRSPPWCCCRRIYSSTGPAPTPQPTPSPTSSAWLCRLPSPSSHTLSHRGGSCGDITITTLTLTTHTLTPPCLALTPSPHSPLSHGMETPHLP